MSLGEVQNVHDEAKEGKKEGDQLFTLSARGERTL
jgi:hypothetical protein